MTPTQKAAMEQALEALEHHTAIKHPQQRHYRDAAIDALRAALADTAEPVETQDSMAADAYNHACDAMEMWQRKRHAEGKEVGTEGSLCDGIAWLYGYIDALEGKLAAPQPPAPSVRLTDEDIDALAEAHRSEYGQLCDRLDLQMFARAAIAAHEAKKGGAA